MTIVEAQRICRNYYRITNPTEDDDFLYTEALKYLIEETKQPGYMVELGAHYYEARQFDLALKYYEIAAESGNVSACTDLGYIWYYGRSGEKNYEKAFKCFDKAARLGSVTAAYKVADMYKNGYHVEKDLDKYKSIIEDLYPKVKNARRLGEPLPEIFTRLAKIRSEEGKTEEALRLYEIARDFLSQRIRSHPFFGDLTIMKYLIADVYKLRPFDKAETGLYDLYHLLSKPAKISFHFEESRHEVESVAEDGGLVVRFDEKWFRTVDDFFRKAELDGEFLTMRYEELYDFEVTGWTD